MPSCIAGPVLKGPSAPWQRPVVVLVEIWMRFAPVRVLGRGEEVKGGDSALLAFRGR